MGCLKTSFFYFYQCHEETFYLVDHLVMTDKDQMLK